MAKKIGLLVGMENTFPAPFLQAVNEKGAADGISAELVVIGKVTEFDVPPRYDVIVDRISHEVGYYRAFLKSAALNGTVVMNDPFWWEADEKFFECTLARHLGVAVPKTVVLPNKSYEAGIVPEKSLRNLQFPLDWDEIVAYTGLPAVLKPNTGGGWRDVYIVHSMEELLRDYDQTSTKTMILQEFIDWEDYVRCVVIGGEVLVFRYDPRRSFLRALRHRRPAAAVARGASHGGCSTHSPMPSATTWTRSSSPFATESCTPSTGSIPRPDFDNFSIKEEGFSWVIDKMSDLVLALRPRRANAAMARRAPLVAVRRPRQLTGHLVRGAVEAYHELLADEELAESSAEQLQRAQHAANLYFGEHPLSISLRPRLISSADWERAVAAARGDRRGAGRARSRHCWPTPTCVESSTSSATRGASGARLPGLPVVVAVGSGSTASSPTKCDTSSTTPSPRPAWPSVTPWPR